LTLCATGNLIASLVQYVAPKRFWLTKYRNRSGVQRPACDLHAGRHFWELPRTTLLLDVCFGIICDRIAMAAPHLLYPHSKHSSAPHNRSKSANSDMNHWLVTDADDANIPVLS
jgi:hypothetical protein